MKRIAVPLVAGILALGFTPSAFAATPRADRYYVVVCNGTEYESVDAHAVELGGKALAVSLFSEHYPFQLQCSLQPRFTA
jgi:hypothetical protein